MIRKFAVAARRIVTALPLVLFAVRPSSVPAQQPDYMRRIMTDSVGYGPVPAMSPDGKWLVWLQDLSDRENSLWVRATSGGEPRKISTVPALQLHPQFTPQGDRLLFLSSLPRRSPTDESLYLMSAPFDSRTGTIGTPRQVTLDGLRGQPRFRFTTSPDGQRVAYTDNQTSALKVIPITGGNPTTLVTPPPGANQRSVPGWFAWTADSKAVLYDARESEGLYARYRVGADGGTPVLLARSQTDRGFGRPIPGTDVSVDLVPLGSGKPWVLRFNDHQGKQIGRDVEMPGLRVAGQFFPSVDGKTIILSYANVLSHIRFVPVGGGDFTTPLRAEGYDWPVGWTPDSRLFYALAEDREHRLIIRGTTVDGKIVARVPIKDAEAFHAILGDRVIVRSTATSLGINPSPGTAMTLWAVNPANGSRTEVAKGIHSECCRAPGGAWFAAKDRAWYLRRNGGRLELMELAASGQSTVVTELPANIESQEMAMGVGRVAYLEPVGDVLRLLIKQGSANAVPIATYTRAQVPSTGEIAWSHDGQQLAVSLATGDMEVFRFDSSGRVTGAPRRLNVPFAYQYDIYWLPDGTGFTSIAQVRDEPFTHVALVKFDNPQQPILLSRNDRQAKWAQQLSPDGRYVAYQAEETHGGAAWAIDVAKALAAARKK